MRLIDTILRSWNLRQHLQDAYEKSLPSTSLNTAYLGTLADSKPRDRMADKPDFIEAASDFAVSKGGKPFTRADLDIPDRQPYSVNPGDIDPSKVFGDIEQRGVIPQGGRRHVGILVWEFVVAWLGRQGIILEVDDEYAALDASYCQKVADLAAEMYIARMETPNATVPLEAAWVREIEQRPDNEALAEQLLVDLFNSFGVRPERVPGPDPLRIEGQPADSTIIPAEVLNPTKEADYAVRARHGERQ